MSMNADKKQLRQRARELRDQQVQIEERSHEVIARLEEQAFWKQASKICCYVSFRSEVQTHDLIQRCLESEKSLSVPYCHGNELELFQISAWEELERSKMGILEPGQAIRNSERRVADGTIGLMIIPGLAFSREGDRLGYGRGYYDRLLQRQPQCLRVAIGFECQLYETVPREEHDQRMHRIVTEHQVYEIRR